VVVPYPGDTTIVRPDGPRTLLRLHTPCYFPSHLPACSSHMVPKDMVYHDKAVERGLSCFVVLQCSYPTPV
jgi:hypothetical protein